MADNAPGARGPDNNAPRGPSNAPRGPNNNAPRGPNNAPRGPDNAPRAPEHRGQPETKNRGHAAAFSGVYLHAMPTNHAEVGKAPRAVLDTTAQCLTVMDPGFVVYKFNQGNQTMIESSNEHVNFYSKMPNRGPTTKAYCAKVSVDEKAIEALANTIKALAVEHHAPIVNMTLDFLTPKFVKLHREDIPRLLSAARAHAAALAEEAGIQSDEALQIETCGNCHREGHEAWQCASPHSRQGAIAACPLCNASPRDHVFDACKTLANADMADDATFKMVFDALFFNRANKPQIRSTRWTWFGLLPEAIQRGIVFADDIHIYPWTNKFATAVWHAGSNAGFLAGMTHPRDIDYSQEDLDDHLPRDPQFQGKTIAEVIELVALGILDDDRFVPKHDLRRRTDDKPEPLAPADIDELVHTAVREIGGFDPATMIARPRAEITALVRADQRFAAQIALEDLAQLPDAIPRPDMDPHGDIRSRVIRFYIDPTAIPDVDDPVVITLLDMHLGAIILHRRRDAIMRDEPGLDKDEMEM